MRERRAQTEIAMRSAYRLYVRYQVQTPQYREIAKGLGISVLDLNARLNAVYSKRLLAKKS